jgi:DeoR/GlpR family transcriptional regulator of sugar metabolism
MSKQKKARGPPRHPETIIDQIYAELQQDGTMTPNQIALKLKANTQTIKRWLDLIKLVQSKPKLIMETGSRITLVRIEK